MRKSWLKSNSICLAMGDSVALNLMFESKQDHELFLEYWIKYLGGMAQLINYHLTPTGWVLLFKTKSDTDICTAYHSLRSQSQKADKTKTYKECSRMLSEHFRIFLSQYVRRTNAHKGRKGTKVLQRFSKYILNEASDYTYFFDLITRRERKIAQTNDKYRADERMYDEQKEMVEESVWQVGTRLYNGMAGWFVRYFEMELIRPESSVLRKYLNHSIPTHFPQNST